MQWLTKTWLLVILVCVATAVLGCEHVQSRHGLKIVPISSFDKIAGEWEGMSKTMPDMRDDASVLLVITERGHFNFVSDRGTELLLGTGKLTFVDGTVVANSSHGTGTFTLHDKADTSVLVADGLLKDGRHFYLEMTRLEQANDPGLRGR
jgi:hypothetical protein